jgi:hypothetical protein
VGLSFTHIADRHGLAIYLLHNGTHTQEQAMKRLAADITARIPEKQIVILSARSQDGERVRDFYDLDPMALPYVLLVRDNDQLAHFWQGPHIPNPEHVIHSAQTESA